MTHFRFKRKPIDGHLFFGVGCFKDAFLKVIMKKNRDLKNKDYYVVNVW